MDNKKILGVYNWWDIVRLSIEENISIERMIIKLDKKNEENKKQILNMIDEKLRSLYNE